MCHFKWSPLTPWLFIDPSDGPIDPWGSILTTLTATALYHNLWTLNLSRSSKVSKDSEDWSLISNKNLSEILPSNGLNPGPGKAGQGGLIVLHLWRHSQKIHVPQPKNFFWVQTRRSFESLNSSLPLLAPDYKATCYPVVLARTTWFRPAPKVLSGFYSIYRKLFDLAECTISQKNQLCMMYIPWTVV